VLICGLFLFSRYRLCSCRRLCHKRGNEEGREHTTNRSLGSARKRRFNHFLHEKLIVLSYFQQKSDLWRQFRVENILQVISGRNNGLRVFLSGCCSHLFEEKLMLCLVRQLVLTLTLIITISDSARLLCMWQHILSSC